MATEETNSLIEQRKAKLAALRAKGIDPFKNKFKPTEKCVEARANYVEGREVSVTRSGYQLRISLSWHGRLL